MAEPNPHRQKARLFAFVCYVFAGLVLLAGVFFTLAAATMDVSTLVDKGMRNQQQLAILVASIFLILVLMIVLFGWRIQSLFGQQRRPDKPVAKSVVGGLRLASLGCGLWILPSAFTILLTGKILPNNGPGGWREIFMGSSGFLVVIILMLAVAWFISANFARLNSEECKRAYQAYIEVVQPLLTKMAEPETRAYVQEQTMEIVPKLDTTLKSNLLEYLSKSRLLTGDTRIGLHYADFRRVDLRSISLPHADLSGINLEQANLQGAILFEVNLHKARLKRADLSYAILQGANLQQADLSGAVTEGTNLRGAHYAESALTREQRRLAKT